MCVETRLYCTIYIHTICVPHNSVCPLMHLPRPFTCPRAQLQLFNWQGSEQNWYWQHSSIRAKTPPFPTSKMVVFQILPDAHNYSPLLVSVYLLSSSFLFSSFLFLSHSLLFPPSMYPRNSICLQYITLKRGRRAYVYNLWRPLSKFSQVQRTKCYHICN